MQAQPHEPQSFPPHLAAWPRGLSRALAAQYIGLGVTTFADMVRNGELPKPIKFRGRHVWDRCSLDACFDSALPNVQPLEPNTWD
jgi:predicted DNA-binding transcriptional regulator AlpA